MVAIVLMLSMWPKGTSVLVRSSSFALIHSRESLILYQDTLHRY